MAARPPYRYLDHTADAMFEAYGRTLDEAFAHAGLAVFSLLADLREVRPTERVEFGLSADTREALLFDFIAELLYLLDTRHLLLCEFEVSIREGDGYDLRCVCRGDAAERYERHGDVKAATYNEMRITHAKDGWTLRAVVDI